MRVSILIQNTFRRQLVTGSDFKALDQKKNSLLFLLNCLAVELL
jgi:hypothetical protein